MPTIGNTTTPTAGWVTPGGGMNQAWSAAFNTSQPILLTTLHAFFGTAAGGTATCALVAWGATGAVLGFVNVSVPQKPSGAGAQQWNAASPASGILVPAGNFLLGFWVPAANGFTTSSESGGSSAMKATGGGISTATGGSSTTIGSLGVYADYSPAGVKVRRSGAWASVPVKVRRSGAWANASVKVRRSGAWVTVG